MASKTYDLCIVGAGIFGLTSALELSSRGFKVIVLEASEIPSPLASSTDISKIVRMEYGHDVQYMEMAEKAMEGWRQWNSEWSEPLFHESGVCMMTRNEMKVGGFEYESYQLLLKRGHLPVRLNNEYISSHFPAWQSAGFVDGYFHEKGGYVESGYVIEKLYNKAKTKGIEIRLNSPAKEIIYDKVRSSGVLLKNNDKIIAGKILLAAGAWTHTLTEELQDRMSSTGHPVFHLEVNNPSIFESAKFPVFTADISKSGWYGFPFHPKKKVVKIANHGIGIKIHPKNDERKVLEEQEVELKRFLRKNLPSLQDAKIVYRRLCLYSDTTDEHFWISRHPNVKNLYIAAGGSGHGFKFGPILGSLISDAIEGVENNWLHKFKWRSFTSDTSGEEAARYHGK
jgi:glycine/D-amino acid oxidase-like deaminating enzyme